jgi:uncharacterized protein YbbK (DUF523 family)/uncharacterized protein YbgA (DUF1722 family)
VRYDGRHKRHKWLVDTLGRCVDFVPLCPEVAIGLGIPREPVHLTGDPEHPRVRAVSNPDRDVTADLQAEGHAVATALGGVSGYVFKSRSPSCGLFHVDVLTESGRTVRSGHGVYSRIIEQAHPCLPLEEESRLDDSALRENFVNRLYTCQRWLSLCAAGLSAQRLLDFHARHKYLLMAHSPDGCRRLERLLSGLRDADLFVLARDYLAGLMTGLMQDSGTTRHVNVLQHILGYLKRSIAASDKAELLAVLEATVTGKFRLSYRSCVCGGTSTAALMSTSACSGTSGRILMNWNCAIICDDCRHFACQGVTVRRIFSGNLDIPGFRYQNGWTCSVARDPHC